MLIPISYPPAVIRKTAVGNSIILYPQDDLIAKYNWLKSSERDSQMGTLSNTNRRTLLLAPGKYTVTSTWVLDINYVDVMGLGNSRDVLISGTLESTAIMQQTANTISLSYFTVENFGYFRGFEINAADNSASVYRFLNFNYSATGGNSSSPVFGLSDLHGLWEFCVGGGGAWRVSNNKKLSATMNFCIGGSRSFGGDLSGAEISGTLKHCVGGQESFGGCANYGCKITGWLEDCTAGDRSYAMGKEFAGVALRCRGGAACFGGYDGTTSYYGTFSGVAIDCNAEGGNSFGMGHTSCVQSGILIRCQNGLDAEYEQGIINTPVHTVQDNSVGSSYTTSLTGDNNDLVFTSKLKGKRPIVGVVALAIEYSTAPPVGNVSIYTMSSSPYAKVIKVKISSGVSTSAEVKSWIEGNATANALVSVAHAPGNDGTGTVTALNPMTTDTVLKNGVNLPYWEGNCPKTPTGCTTDRTIYPFDNGHTFTNKNASGAITFSLPVARIGLFYRFVVKTAQELRIDPNGTETIALADGTQQAAGKYIVASGVGATCLLKCVELGKWEHWDSVGTWTAET